MSFEVDVDSVRQAQARLGQLEQHAADIMSLAADANPEWYIWGLVGAPFAAIYWQFADDLYEHLGQLGEALKDRAESLEGSMQIYHSTEQAIVDSLTKIHDVLD